MDVGPWPRPNNAMFSALLRRLGYIESEE